MTLPDESTTNNMADESGHNSLRTGSDFTIEEKGQLHKPQMSKLHEIAFILTICMAQILALAGLGMALCKLHARTPNVTYF
jgi:methylthioribose-1-phosphate isomerase